MAIATKSIDVESNCSTGEPGRCGAIGIRGQPVGECE